MEQIAVELEENLYKSINDMFDSMEDEERKEINEALIHYQDFV
ncbi:hypothetical protein Q5M85_04585 [Paraclostridium bifermentans]|nr:hypothetical protein [Paraclostridium bifermentans]